jgi:hypothetical protein
MTPSGWWPQAQNFIKGNLFTKRDIMGMDAWEDLKTRPFHHSVVLQRRKKAKENFL